jgi:hypothetical protein
MDIDTGAQQDLRHPAARFNEKGCLQVWRGDALRTLNIEMTQKYDVQVLKIVTIIMAG